MSHDDSKRASRGGNVRYQQSMAPTPLLAVGVIFAKDAKLEDYIVSRCEIIIVLILRPAAITVAHMLKGPWVLYKRHYRRGVVLE